MRSANYKQIGIRKDREVEIPRSEVTTFKGTVKDGLYSQVRLNLDGKKIEGFFQVGDNKYYIEPVKNYSSGAVSTDFVVYNERDSLKVQAISCGLENRINKGVSMVKNKLSEPKMSGTQLVNAKFDFSPTYASTIKSFLRSPVIRTSSLQANRIAEFITDADFDYVAIYYSQFESEVFWLKDANKEIHEVLNLVEPLYQAEVGISFSILSQRGWLYPDPYDNYGVYPDEDTVPGTAAYAYWVHNNNINYWELNRPRSSIPRDAVLTYTGKNCPYNYANIGGLCSNLSNSLGYAMLVGANQANPGRQIQAHEIGHLFFGTHIIEFDIINYYPDCWNSILGIGDPTQPNYSNPFRMCSYTRQQINYFLDESGLNTCVN